MPFQYSLFPEQASKIAIVDIETTGFLNQKGLIVEIGIVSLDLHTGEINTEFDSLVREPGFNKAHTSHPYGWIFQNSSLKYEAVCQARQINTHTLNNIIVPNHAPTPMGAAEPCSINALAMPLISAVPWPAIK